MKLFQLFFKSVLMALLAAAVALVGYSEITKRRVNEVEQRCIRAAQEICAPCLKLSQEKKD